MTNADSQYLFDGDDQATFEHALDVWGIDAQAEQAEEEVAELLVELRRYNRGEGTVEGLVDELADVRVMYEQLDLFLDMYADRPLRVTERTPPDDLIAALGEFLVVSKHWGKRKVDVDTVAEQLDNVRLVYEQVVEEVGRERTEKRIAEKMDRLRKRLKETDNAN